jgi:hypothetical protein
LSDGWPDWLWRVPSHRLPYAHDPSAGWRFVVASGTLCEAVSSPRSSGEIQH